MFERRVAEIPVLFHGTCPVSWNCFWTMMKSGRSAGCLQKHVNSTGNKSERCHLRISHGTPPGLGKDIEQRPLDHLAIPKQHAGVLHRHGMAEAVTAVPPTAGHSLPRKTLRTGADCTSPEFEGGLGSSYQR